MCVCDSRNGLDLAELVSLQYWCVGYNTSCIVRDHFEILHTHVG